MKRMLVVLAVVICVLPLSSCWIFNSLFGTNNDWAGPMPLPGGSSPVSAATMNPDTWYTDSVGSAEILWYELLVTPGSTYSISWDDDYEGSGSYTGDVYVSAVMMDGSSTYQGEHDSGYDSPMQVTATEPYIYLRVRGYSSGSFAIGYEEAN